MPPTFGRDSRVAPMPLSRRRPRPSNATDSAGDKQTSAHGIPSENVPAPKRQRCSINNNNTITTTTVAATTAPLAAPTVTIPPPVFTAQPPAPQASTLSSSITFRSTYRTDLAKRGLLVRGSLGSGSYSKVKMVLDATFKPSKMVAVKIVDRVRAPKDYLEHFLPRELQIWSRLSHPNLVQLLDYFEDSYRVYMLLEFVEGGDALRCIQTSGAVPERTAKVWLGQMVDAVRYMHDRNIAHRDLKLENLLLSNNAQVIKLCDFGFVKEVGGAAEFSQTFCGSKAYAAPEILKGRSYDPKKGDIWAMGVILYIFVTAKMPFNETRSTRRILEDQKALRLQWNKVVSSRCHELVMRMLTWEFTARPSIHRIEADEWLNPLVPQYSLRGSYTFGMTPAPPSSAQTAQV